jgi:MFS family permease
MTSRRAPSIFVNVAHTYDHLFMLLYPTAVLALDGAWGLGYDELLTLSVGGFVAFGLGTLPAGWLGDRWSRTGMLAIFFVGIGASSIATGLAQSPVGLAIGLSLIGLFASIYHPVGIALVVGGAGQVGRALGVNGVFGNMGVAVAALTAGALSDLYGWRAAFLAPGVLALVTGVAYLWCLSRASDLSPSPDNTAAFHGGGREARVRVFIVLAVAALFGGLIYSAITVAMPKVFDVRVAVLAGSGLGIGGVLAIIYAVAAFAQIIVGRLIDRLPIGRVYMAILLLQVPVLLAASTLHGMPLVAVTLVAMALIFGEIPIHDALVARYTPANWRSRVYAVKYFVGLGVGALGVPMVALIYRLSGDFTWLFVAYAALAFAMAMIATLLPRRRDEKSAIVARPV